MTEIRTAPVKAQRVDVVNSEAPPGAFKFYVNDASIYQKWSAVVSDQKPDGLVYVCPCGCGRAGVWISV